MPICASSRRGVRPLSPRAAALQNGNRQSARGAPPLRGPAHFAPKDVESAAAHVRLPPFHLCLGQDWVVQDYGRRHNAAPRDWRAHDHAHCTVPPRTARPHAWGLQMSEAVSRMFMCGGVCAVSGNPEWGQL